MSSRAAYAELHSWSNFSFLEGGSHPEEMAERARALGLAALALTDRDGIYGAVRFAKHAAIVGIPAICGAELTLEDGARLVLLAESERGYANLAHAISTAQLRGRKRDARCKPAMNAEPSRPARVCAISFPAHFFASCSIICVPKMGRLRKG